jgi:Tfp pilus assembly protein PilP
MRVLTVMFAALAFVAMPAASNAQSKAQAKTVALADSIKPAAPARPASNRNQITIEREAFTYSHEGRRDPFVSLMGSSELRPMISDLRLVVVVYDPDGGSRAVLRDINTNEQYKVRVGQQLGRMRVARIAPKSVTFTILEFGESRQETLALNDSTTARTP